MIEHRYTRVRLIFTDLLQLNTRRTDIRGSDFARRRNLNIRTDLIKKVKKSVRNPSHPCHPCSILSLWEII